MAVIHISKGWIEEITSERGTTFVTVAYMEGAGNRRTEQRVRMVVDSRTIIVNTNGTIVPVTGSSVGMTINAFISSAMTRSIPPQAVAYLIEIVSRPPTENLTTGRILEINRNNRSFTTVSDRDLTSIIRFNVTDSTTILNRAGRPMNFSGLTPGMRVRVRHANFMTASIPPQTTAFEIRVLQK